MADRGFPTWGHQGYARDDFIQPTFSKICMRKIGLGDCVNPLFPYQICKKGAIFKFWIIVWSCIYFTVTCYGVYDTGVTTGGSTGVPRTLPPVGSTFFVSMLFCVENLPKYQVGSVPLRLTSPVWRILDPPLVSVICMTLRPYNFTLDTFLRPLVSLRRNWSFQNLICVNFG